MSSIDKTSTPPEDHAVENPEAAAAAVTVVDPRLLVREQGLAGYVSEFKRKMKAGDLGSIPVVIGLAIIWIIFQSLNSNFLTAGNLSDISVAMVGTGMIAVGIVFVLLLGEIDLSVGSVSGVAGASFAVLNVTNGMNEWLAFVLAILTGTAAGAIHGFFFAKIGVPAFAVTLAGLLFWNGFMLKILGDSGTINLDSEGLVGKLTSYYFSDVAAAYGLAIAATALYFLSSFYDNRRREAAGVPSRPLSDTILRTVLLAVVSFAAAMVFNSHRACRWPWCSSSRSCCSRTSSCAAPPTAARCSRSAAASRRPAVPVSTWRWSGSRSSRSPAPSPPSAVCSSRPRSPRRTRAPAPVTC